MKFKFTEEAYYTYLGRAARGHEQCWTCEYDEFTSKSLHLPCAILEERGLKVKHIMLGVQAKTYFHVEKTLNCLIDSTPAALSYGVPEHIGCMLGWDIWSDYKLDQQFMRDGDILLITEDKDEEVRDTILIRLHRPDRGMRPLVL